MIEQYEDTWIFTVKNVICLPIKQSIWFLLSCGTKKKKSWVSAFNGRKRTAIYLRASYTGFVVILMLKRTSDKYVFIALVRLNYLSYSLIICSSYLVENWSAESDDE